MLQWQSVAVTDTGKKRQINEDSVFVNDTQLIWAVADGMGGHSRGDYASQTVVKHLELYRDSRKSGVSMARIGELLTDANTDLIEKARQENADIVASTAAILCARPDSVICSWVGDSRVYRYRNGELLQLTRDHNYEALLLDLSNSGVETPMNLVDPQALTRGVGAEDTLDTEHCRYNAQAGDRYLVCTDGLYKEIEEQQIESLFAQWPNDAELIEQLHQMYLSGGARDNLGMVLVSAAAG